MSIPAIPPIGAAGAAPLAGTPEVASPGFGATVARGLEQVSGLEHAANAVTESIATGGPAQLHELMAATTKASLSTDLLVQVRNRAVEAYQEIMRLQV